MISFEIDFDNTVDRSRFINSIEEFHITSEYSVKRCTLLSITLICKSFSDGLMLVRTVDNLLNSLEIEVRPFSFRYSELLD